MPKIRKMEINKSVLKEFSQSSVFYLQEIPQNLYWNYNWITDMSDLG